MKKMKCFWVCVCIFMLTGCAGLPDIAGGNDAGPSPEATGSVVEPGQEISGTPTAEPTPEIFASEEERTAAELIDASIEQAISAVWLNRRDDNPAIMKSTYFEPFEEDLSWIEKYNDSQKELFWKLTEAGQNREELVVKESEYGKNMLMDYLTIATAIERYDPYTSCFCYVDITGSDLLVKYFDPHKDANYCVEKESPEYEKMESDMKLLDAILTRVVKKMPEGLSTYEKYYYLAAVVSARVHYNLETKNRANAFGALVDGEALCEGYAESFYLLCKEANLACYLQSGLTPDGGHAWNLIALEGGSYHVDVTWCDNYEPDDWRWSRYFAMTDDESITCGHELREGKPATGSQY